MRQEISKMSPKMLLKRFKIKSHESRAFYLFLARNDESKIRSEGGPLLKG